jgi:hypothetical protein
MYDDELGADLASVCLSEITQFNTPYAARIDIKERVAVQNKVRAMNIAKREKLRNDKFAALGEKNQQDKIFSSTVAEENRQKRMQELEDSRQLRTKAILEKQLCDKEFQELDIRRNIQVDDKRNTMARQEKLKHAADRAEETKQKQETQRKLQKDRQQAGQQQRKERIEKQMVDERRQKLDESRDEAIQRKEGKLRAKQMHRLQQLNAQKEQDHRKMLRRKELKEKSRLEHATFCATVRKSRSDREQENLKLELERETQLQEKEQERNLLLKEEQRSWFHSEEERNQEVEQRKLAQVARAHESKRAEAQRRREEKQANVQLEISRQAKINEKERVRKERGRQMAEGYQMSAEDKTMRELVRREKYMTDMKQLKYIAVKNRRQSQDLQEKREEVMVTKCKDRVDKENQLLLAERAKFNETAQKRKEQLERHALEKEKHKETKLEKQLREKQRQREIEEKRGDAIQRKERTRDERARLDCMALKEV